MDPENLRQQIELDVVELLKNRLADGSLTEERAQAISQHVLKTLVPGMNAKDFYKRIPELDDAFPELSPIILPILRAVEENINQKVVSSVANLIRVGQYDAATKLAQDTINQDVDQVWQGSGKP